MMVDIPDIKSTFVGYTCTKCGQSFLWLSKAVEHVEDALGCPDAIDEVKEEESKYERY